ncbi:MAG: DUF3040 domain-containing protein, partial [Actinobacteria bacterium]
AEPDQVDLDRFAQHAAEGRRALEAGEHDRASKSLRGALALWRGPPLADFAYESFAQVEIGRLEEARLAVLEDRIDADLALGDHAQLVGELEALCREHPNRERLQRQLVLALYRSGRQADALERYRRVRQAMVDELGLEPGRELQELERAILAQDPALEAPARPTRSERLAARARVGRGAILIVGGGLALLAVVVAAVAISSDGGGGIAVSPNSVAVIDPGTDKLTADSPVGVKPTDLSVGDGAVWVANSGDASVSQIDTQTHRVTATIAPGSAVDGMAAGVGAVWTSDVRRGRLARIDPALRRVDHSIRVGGGPLLGSAGGPVAIGAGSVWASTGRGAVARIDPRRDHVEARITVGSDPSGIAVGAGGVWVADDDDNTVTRIDPATDGVLTTIPVGPGASGIAVGEGAVWVVEPFDNAVARIDPKTNSVTDTIPVGEAPAGVTVGAGAVWVANSGSGTVSRDDLGRWQPAIGGDCQRLAVGERAAGSGERPSRRGGHRAGLRGAAAVRGHACRLHRPGLRRAVAADLRDLRAAPQLPRPAVPRRRPPPARPRACHARGYQRRQDVHLPAPRRLSLLSAEQSTGHRRRLPACHRTEPRPAHALVCHQLDGRHRRLQGV